MSFPPASQADLDRVARDLGRGKEKRSGSGWMTLCPVPEHGDTNPSLKVDLKDGELLFHCHGGCGQSLVFNTIKDLGLLPKGPKYKASSAAIDWNEAENGPAKNDDFIPRLRNTFAPLNIAPSGVSLTWGQGEEEGGPLRLTRVHQYNNALGEPLGLVARYEKKGASKATIPYFVKEAGFWRPKLGEYRQTKLRPLYRLDRLDADIVVIVEGEKAADKLAEMLEFEEHKLFTVTTWPMGKNAWKQVDWSTIAGKRVILWPDNEGKARAAMRKCGEHLRTLGHEVEWICWGHEAREPGEQDADAYDVCEWLGVEDSINEWINRHRISLNNSCIKPEAPKETASDLEPYEISLSDTLNDYRNAQLFVECAGDRYRYTPEFLWHGWDGTKWVPGEAPLATCAELSAKWIEIAETAPSEKERKAAIRWARTTGNAKSAEAFLKLARGLPEIARRDDEFDADWWSINTLNGIYDVREDCFTPHSEHSRPMVRKQAAVQYDPSARCPVFEKFLNEILIIKDDAAASAEYVKFVQTALGYSMTALPKDQKFFFCYGTGSNGKTTLLETMLNILGDYARPTTASLILHTPGTFAGNTDYMNAYLHGARFVLPGEIGKDSEFNETQLKNLVGGGTISARNPAGKHFSFKVSFKLWLCGNHKPEVNSDDDALWRRMICLPFNCQIPEARQNKDLQHQLWEERSGIFNWIIEGARRYHQHGLVLPDFLDAEVKQYRKDADVIARFIEESCDRDGLLRVKSGELYRAYVQWCEKSGEKKKVLSKKAFSSDMKRRGFELKSTGDCRWICGLGLKADGEDNSTREDERIW